MKTLNKYTSLSLWLAATLLTASMTGCFLDSDNDSTADSDPAALTVISTNPANAATAVATNQKVTATFSEAMNSATLDGSSFTVEGAGEPAITGNVTLDAASNTAIFAPNSNLSISKVYTATITTAAESSTGKTMAGNYVWNFTSGTATDDVAPTVSSTDPADVATDFLLNRNITASFSESLDPSTVDTTTFTLTTTADTSTHISGVVSYNDNGMVASFNPDANLAASVDYTATLTTGIEDLAGNAMTSVVSWTFSGTAVSAARLPVDLGTSGDFAVLAETKISKTGAAGTMVTGDIGISPAAQTFITGFSETLDSSNTFATSDFVTGSIYAADMAPPTPTKMTTAIGDMVIAYNDAAGRTTPDFTELGAGNVSGMTLEPGLYKWGTNLLITNVGVTLSGSATDVWIFQISGDLIVDNAAIVTLAGGALPENVFWQVEGGTGVSLGTTSQFSGIVLATKAIIVNSGAAVNGRLLAQTAVTLDGNAVTEPAE